MTTDAWHRALSHISEKLGQPPRSFPRSTLQRYLIAEAPAWTDQGDLSFYHAHSQTLLENGYVVSGHVVQANTQIYEAGNQDAPGVVVYCEHERSLISPDELREIAQSLFRLRTQRPSDDPEARRLGEGLADEFTLFRGVVVPASISPRYRCRISSVLFHRKHLPSGILLDYLVPLLVSRKTGGAVMTVPSKYWPANLVKEWVKIPAENEPKKSLFFEALGCFPSIFLGKVILGAFAVLLLIPETIKFINQEKPIAITDFSQLDALAEDTIIEVAAPLDRNIELKISKYRRASPFAGTDNKIWYTDFAISDRSEEALERKICKIESKKHLSKEFAEALHAHEVSYQLPLTILSKSQPPTLGMKAWRVAIILIAVAVIYFAFRSVRKWWKS